MPPKYCRFVEREAERASDCSEDDEYDDDEDEDDSLDGFVVRSGDEEEEEEEEGEECEEEEEEEDNDSDGFVQRSDEAEEGGEEEEEEQEEGGEEVEGRGRKEKHRKRKEERMREQCLEAKRELERLELQKERALMELEYLDRELQTRISRSGRVHITSKAAPVHSRGKGSRKRIESSGSEGEGNNNGQKGGRAADGDADDDGHHYHHKAVPPPMPKRARVLAAESSSASSPSATPTAGLLLLSPSPTPSQPNRHSPARSGSRPRTAILTGGAAAKSRPAPVFSPGALPFSPFVAPLLSSPGSCDRGSPISRASSAASISPAAGPPLKLRSSYLIKRAAPIREPPPSRPSVPAREAWVAPMQEMRRASAAQAAAKTNKCHNRAASTKSAPGQTRPTNHSKAARLDAQTTGLPKDQLVLGADGTLYMRHPDGSVNPFSSSV